MKSSIARLLGGIAVLAVTAGISASAHAQTAPAPAAEPFVIKGQLKFQGTGTANPDLGTGDDDDIGLLGTEAKIRATVNFNEDNLFYWEGRGVAGWGQGGFESADSGSVARDNNFLEWRESYFKFNNLGNQPVYLQAGRQRVREDYGLWYNRNFDAVRLGYNTTLFNGFLLAGQNLFSYNSAEDFRKNDKDIFRTIAEGSWQYHYDQFFETRFMYQDDHSGLPDIGDNEDANDRDDSEGHLFWAGIRAKGKTDSFLSADKISYRVDLIGVTGSEDINTAAPAGSGSVVVTGRDDRDVNGWAFDAGIDIPVAMAAKPVIHLGYAYGSGDDGTGDDHGFRQSGLGANFSRIGVLSQSTYQYGTVLRPELSNLHILTAGFTLPMFSESDGGVLYHYYRLADDDGTVNASGIDTTTTGDSHDLGHAVDFMFNTPLYGSAETGSFGHLNAAYLRTSVGAFRAGDAYGSNDGEIAARGLVEVGLNF